MSLSTISSHDSHQTIFFYVQVEHELVCRKIVPGKQLKGASAA